LIEDHSVIKATLMRSTLHLFTADDYLLLRATLQAVLTNAFEDIAKRRGAGNAIDFDKVVKAAREFITQEPRSFAEISAMLTELAPDADVGSMRYGVRTHIPLVQVPTQTVWSYPGNPKFTLAEAWLGQSLPDKDHLPTLIKRYLAAFGPASVTDIQTWSGLPKLKEAVEALRTELVVYRDEGRRELFDLPELEIPAKDTPAPERFLPEYDNLLLSHSKRTRVIADEYRSQVYLPGLRVRSTILVDGFVRGGWKIETTKKNAVLTIEPFVPLTQQNRDALAAEGEKLVRFAAADAKTFEVKFAEQPNL
jgi:hypothetical protein